MGDFFFFGPPPPPPPRKETSNTSAVCRKLEVKLQSASSSSFKRFDLSVIGLSVLIIATFIERLAPCFKYIILCNSHSHPQKFLLLVPQSYSLEAEAQSGEGVYLGPRSRDSKVRSARAPEPGCLALLLSLCHLCVTQKLSFPAP